MTYGDLRPGDILFRRFMTHGGNYRTQTWLVLNVDSEMGIRWLITYDLGEIEILQSTDKYLTMEIYPGFDLI